MFLVVLAGIRQIEPFGHVEVNLHRRAVPLAAERVLEREVDLRPVERTVAGFEVVVDVLILQDRFKLGLGFSQISSPPTDFSGRVANWTV